MTRRQTRSRPAPRRSGTAARTTRSPDAAALTIAEFQARIAAVYGAKDAQRGSAGTFMYLMEEVGELAEALREPERHDLPSEFADCLAWLASLAHLSGVDLAAAVAAKYGAGCTTCGRSPCTCATKP